MNYNWRNPLTRPELRATIPFRKWLSAIYDKTESNEDRIEILEGRTPSIAHYVTTGTGASVAADADTTDFTGQDFTDGARADVTIDRNAYFYHDTNGNGVLQYTFIGTRPRMVGVGGDGTTDADYQVVGTVDHGAMQGLGDDDHQQYHNDARGDFRYYTKGQIDTQQGLQDAAINANTAKNVEQDGRLDGIDARIDQLIVDITANFVLAGYGNMYQSTPGHSMPNLGGGWQHIDSFDTIPLERGVDLSTPGTFSFAAPGVWLLSAAFSLHHNSSNGGRSTNFRLYNVTDGVGGNGVTVGIGRNVEDSNIAVSNEYEITQALVGKVYRLELGGGDSVTSVEMNASSLSFAQVGTGNDVLTPAP